MVEKLDSESVVSKNPRKLKERERERERQTEETLANAMRCKSKLFFFNFLQLQ